jgi:hypothetical protein
VKSHIEVGSGTLNLPWQQASLMRSGGGIGLQCESCSFVSVADIGKEVPRHLEANYGYLSVQLDCHGSGSSMGLDSS